MGIKQIDIDDSHGLGAEKSNFNDQWLRSLIEHAVKSGYEQEFTTPSDTWVIVHNLNTKIFTYLCTDLSDEEYIPGPVAMEIDSYDQFTIHWAIPVTGKAKVMLGMSGWTYPGQSEIGWPSDMNWGDGGAVIDPTDSIADAVDKINEKLLAPVPPGADLQAAYNAGALISVDIGVPVGISSVAADDVLHLDQLDAGGYGVPLTIQNLGLSKSILLTGTTTDIGAIGSDVKLSTTTSGDVVLDTADGMVFKLSDAAGVSTISITDLGDVEVMSINSDGTLSSNGYLKAVAHVMTPQVGEPFAGARPKLYVETGNDHLYYVDSAGTAFDLTAAAATERRAVDVFVIDATIQTNNYVDLSDTPAADSEFVFLDGVCLIEGVGNDYTVSTNRVTFNAAWAPLPLANTIQVKYNLDVEAETWGVEDFQDSNDYVVLGDAPVFNTENVFANGVALIKGQFNDYTVSGSTLTFATGVKLPTTVIHVKYKYVP